MYKEIEIDGEILKLKTELVLEEPGIVMAKKKLEDTIDLQKVVEEIENGKN